MADSTRETLKLAGSEAFPQLRALASETRLRILELLAEQDMNIQELCLSLGVSQPSVTKHVQALEEVGLIHSDYSTGSQGTQKRCHLSVEKVIVNFDVPLVVTPSVAEIQLPVGLYSGVRALPTCGLATRDAFIGYVDDPLAFHFPERGQAEILWVGDGYVEYIFPNTLPKSVLIHRLDFSVELCSETPSYNNEFPSDITLWINDVEIGTWRSPGDMGGRRGRLNPTWWADSMNQYGFLKIWTTDEKGSAIDGVPVSDVTLSQLEIQPWQPTKIRIGIKEDAENKGGFTLFGRGFGNYAQDLLLRLHYRERNGRTNG